MFLSSNTLRNFIAIGLFFLLTACSSSLWGGSSDGVDPSLEVTEGDLEMERRRWGEGSIPQALADGAFQDVLFAYDSAVVEQKYHDSIRQNAQVLVEDQTLQVEVEGHCDKRGTNEYNLALGEERAKAIAMLLISYGARATQVSTISYGEEIPIDPGDSESAFAKNRRVHFALFRVKE